MSNELKMQVVFSMIEKVTAPLKKIRSGAGDAGRALKETRDRLRELEKQQKEMDSARELAGKVRSSHTAYAAAKKELEAMALKLRGVENPTRAMARSFDAAQSKVKDLHAEGEKYRTQLREVSGRLSEAGISAEKYQMTQRGLKSSIAATNAQLTAQKEKLAASERQQRLEDQHRARSDRLHRVSARLAGSGVGATAAGTAMGTPVLAGLNEAKHYQAEASRVQALGLGAQADAEALKLAEDMKAYGLSQRETLELLRDAITAFGDVHHAKMALPVMAKMKFANRVLYGHELAAEYDRMFMDTIKVIEERGGTESGERFEREANKMQRVITATGGRVNSTEMLNFIKTGGVAAKIMDEDSFYYQMEPLIQMIGGHRAGTALMSGYQNLYQGRTTHRAVKNLEDLGLIGDKNKVTFDKVGQVATLGPGALLGSDIFRRSQFEWAEQVLLPQLAKKGITNPQEIEDTVASIFTTRTAANQFLDMVRQRTQIHKNAKLNAGAYNIDQLVELARKIAAGQDVNALSKIADLKLKLGTQILPLYTTALEHATQAIAAFTAFMERNPTLTKAMVIGLTGIAAVLLVVGPLLLSIAAVIGPYAILQFLFTRIAVSGPAVATVIKGIGTAVMWLCRALVTTPIGLAITAIVGAALLIYTYWDPIAGFFKNIWQEICAAFSGGIGSIVTLLLNWSPLGLLYRASATMMSWFGIELPTRFTDFGVMLLRGLANGIVSGLGLVKDTLMSAGTAIIGWFREKLGIRSPSRIFAELGDYTMQGLAQGLQRGQDGPLGIIGSLAGKLTAAGAAVTIGGAALPAMAFDTRPPVSPAAAPAITYQGDTIHITIHATPGMDEQTLARAVAAELDRRELARASRQRARLADLD